MYSRCRIVSNFVNSQCANNDVTFAALSLYKVSALIVYHGTAPMKLVSVYPSSRCLVRGHHRTTLVAAMTLFRYYRNLIGFFFLLKIINRLGTLTRKKISVRLTHISSEMQVTKSNILFQKDNFIPTQIITHKI